MASGSEILVDELKQLSRADQKEPTHLWQGIDLFFLAMTGNTCETHHEALESVLQITWCHAGQMVWTMGGGTSVWLNPGNFALHSLCACADSHFALPSKNFEGLILCVDTDALSAHPPELLIGGDNLGDILREKYCRGDRPLFLAEDAQAQRLFSDLFGCSGRWKAPTQRLKALELLLYLAEADSAPLTCLEEFTREQVEIVRKIHDELLKHMDRRFTIEELSRQYLINPTTLKAAFKSVYGNSLAAHIREHRMEKAASLLRETGMSVAEIARAVGYDSQSRFTEAFKAVYHVLPRAFRKQS